MNRRSNVIAKITESQVADALVLLGQRPRSWQEIANRVNIFGSTLSRYRRAAGIMSELRSRGVPVVHDLASKTYRIDPARVPKLIQHLENRMEGYRVTIAALKAFA